MSNATKFLTRCAVGLTLAGSAGATFVAGAGSALAPDVVRVTSGLGSGVRSTPGYYVNTATPTQVLLWTSEFSGGSPLPAVGTPCSSAGLLPGAVTKQVIVAFHSLRACR